MSPNIYITFAIHVVICLTVTVIINLLNNFFDSHKNIPSYNNGRDLTIDVLRTICIILMILGHCSIDIGLRNFIFSFHMMAFVFLSGYLYKDSDNIFERICKEIKRLIIPLLIFSILFVYIKHMGFINELKSLIFGMSFTRRMFTEAKSIGPFYFVLLLFIVKIVYILINKLIKIIDFKNNECIKSTLIYVILSYTGVILGKKGFWLPWSADVALYSLIFFHIGYLCKKHDILRNLIERKYLYFILSSIWVFMIYSGSMEIAVRKYEPFGLVLLGTLSGILIMYIISNSISKRIGNLGNKITSLVGSRTIYILIIHTLFNGKIVKFFNDLGLDSKNIFNFTISLCVQIIGGILIFCIIKLLTSQIQKLKLKLIPKGNN